MQDAIRRTEGLSVVEAAVEDLVVADLDLSRVPESAARSLFLKHRRPELYAEWVTRGS